MPFKSKQQMKWMFANHPAMAERWADETPSIKELPEQRHKRELRKAAEACARKGKHK